MTISFLVIAALALAAAGGVVYMGVHLTWRAVSLYKIRQAGPPPLKAHHAVLWRDPGAVERLDFFGGPGGRQGAPRPPFQFVEEHAAGTSPCVSVRDANGRTWRVKWGDEVQSETFGVRLIWAVGYFAEAAYFVPEGRIEGAPALERAAQCLGEDCRFANARFELDERSVRKLFDEHGWAWNANPFVGTHELNGLKVMSMLISNWDNKDVRDVARGSNTAIFEYQLPDGSIEARYLIIDWGGSMGKWGTFVTRAKWDSVGFEAQTPQFVAGVQDGTVKWGYAGQRTADAVEGIRVEDVRWLCQYLSRITDAQVLDALRASGAELEEADRFARAIRNRITQLERVCELGDAYQPLVAETPEPGAA